MRGKRKPAASGRAPGRIIADACDSYDTECRESRFLASRIAPPDLQGSEMRLGEGAATFTVARNPDPDSTLPFLLRVPLPGHDLLLKARDSWPRTEKVYCHRATHWPETAVVVEEVPVRSCVRRGVAIDLVLDRARENRSQLVFTRIKGDREGIFWQSPKTTRKSRPGIRIPSRGPVVSAARRSTSTPANVSVQVRQAAGDDRSARVAER